MIRYVTRSSARAWLSAHHFRDEPFAAYRDWQRSLGAPRPVDPPCPVVCLDCGASYDDILDRALTACPGLPPQEATR